MKIGVLSKVVSSNLVNIEKAGTSAVVEIELEAANPIPLFTSFGQKDEPGGFAAKEFLNSFVGKGVKYSTAKGSSKGSIWIDGEESKPELSLNNQLQVFLKTKRSEAIFDKIIDFRSSSNINDASTKHHLNLTQGQKYSIYFQEVNEEGRFLGLDSSSQQLFWFAPDFLTVPVIGPNYKQFLENKLHVAGILGKHIQVEVTGITFNPSNNAPLVHGIIADKTSFLLQEGLALLSETAYITIKDQVQLESFDELAITAQSQGKGVWSKQTDFDSLINRIDSFLAIVREVESGSILVVEKADCVDRLDVNLSDDKPFSNLMKIQLSNIICPQGLERGSFEAREFTRKLVIGQEVDIFLEKESGFLPCATVVLSASQLHLNQHLVAQGFAKIREEFKGHFTDPKWVQAEAAQKEAIAAQKGIHNKDLGITRFKEIGVKETIDLFETHIKQNMKKESHNCIVEKIISGDRLLLRLVSYSVIVKSKLFGIKSFQNDPNQPSLQKSFKQSVDYNYKTLMNKNVTVTIMGIHDGCFIVKLINSKKQDQSKMLLQEGLAYCKQEIDTYDSSYEECQDRAKKQQKGVWVQKEIQVILELHDNSSKMLKLIKQSSSEGLGKLQVNVAQLKNTGEFYLTLENSSDLQKEIDATVDSFDFDSLPKLIGVKINTLCVAKSVVDSKLYRGKIISKIIKQNVEVEFIDYGITERLPLTNVVSLPLELAKYEAQCQLCSLAYIRVPTETHKLVKQSVKEFEKLLDKGYVEAEFVGNKKNQTSVILTYENEPELEWSLNAQMIRLGYARIDFSIPQNPFKDEFFQDLELEASDKQIGIWAIDNQDRLSDMEMNDSD